jgi:FMN phosphatase YigB (HAD superfamily)
MSQIVAAEAGQSERARVSKGGTNPYNPPIPGNGEPRHVRSSITSIVFDIGWVLAHLDYSRLSTFLRDHGVNMERPYEVFARAELTAHETGRLAGDGLLANLASLGNRPMDAAVLRSCWNDMFELQVPMVNLARRLAERYRVHLLSNIGDLHWAHLSREYRLHRLGHGALPSFVAGVMKPEPGIYAQAERRFELEPARTVFIDDRPENIEQASARGWQGIRHVGYRQTVEALAGLGVTD